MRRFLILLLLAPTLSFAADWKLVWSDEFDKAGLPDSTRWDYEVGFVRNQELQYYTRSRRENAVVENGMLVLTAAREKYKNPMYKSADNRSYRQAREYAEYTSASLTTKGHASWTYGKIEVRAKLPAGNGMWPAIWMLGNDIERVGWPECGEIDIMENVGYEPDNIYGTIHTGKFNHVKKTQKGSHVSVPNSSADFHVYGLEWDPRRITISVDNKDYFSFDNDGSGEAAWPFDKDFYLILNIAVGGAWGGVKGVDPAIFPQRMFVDYVRVYHKSE